MDLPIDDALANAKAQASRLPVIPRGYPVLHFAWVVQRVRDLPCASG